MSAEKAHWAEFYRELPGVRADWQLLNPPLYVQAIDSQSIFSEAIFPSWQYRIQRTVTA
jgi:hypothetical protein